MCFLVPCGQLCAPARGLQSVSVAGLLQTFILETDKAFNGELNFKAWGAYVEGGRGLDSLEPPQMFGGSFTGFVFL